MPGAEPLLTGTAGEDGILILGDLSIGNYRLVETAAPAGYELAAAAVKITVSASEVSAVQSGQASEVFRKGDSYWVEGQEDDTWQIRVWNSSGIALPATGGPGSAGLYLTGALLMLGAAICLVIRRSRNGN